MPSILLIEDNDPLRTALLHLLKRNGYIVFGASDGSLGVAIVNKEHIDLIITDVYMPIQDGIETIIQIHRMYPTLPIIVMSGGPQVKIPEVVLDSAILFGACFQLQKPFGNKRFLEVIEQALCMK